jgi:hypothetical protein
MSRHVHGEAFKLMTYASGDRQTIEFIWNSRDGVTPFVVTARDGVTQLTHVDWHGDKYQPYRIPEVGERIFVDLTAARAVAAGRRNAERFWNDPAYPAAQDPRYADVHDLARQLTAAYLEQPGSPDLVEVDEQLRSTFLPKLPTGGRADDDTTDQGRPGGETAADTRAGADSREVGAVVSEAKPVSEEGAPGERSARRPPEPERWDTPEAIIAGHLASAQRCHEHLNTSSPADPKWGEAITGLVHGWTVAALMETLRLAAPKVADRLAAELQSAWDDGAAVSELLWEWRQHLAAGRPISTPGRYETLFERAVGQ